MVTLQPPPSGGRDPQRFFTPAQKAEIAALQRYRCGHCDSDLAEGEWEAHHVIRHEHGGRTVVDNGIGLCKPCHRVAEIVNPEFSPRHWQERAQKPILEPLMGGRFATLNVAPGGGKTPFAGWVARTLLERGMIDRVAIAVPFVPLCEQWQETLSSSFGIYVGVNIASERRTEKGIVLTYASLLKHLDQLVRDAAESRTFWILDEVHHLSVDGSGGASAWAWATEQIVGNIDHPKMPVLNLTGTLFRSRQKERIPTVRYVMPAPGVLESCADFTISAAELIREGVLRGLRVLGFDQDMSVRGINLAEEAHGDAQSLRAVDLDVLPRRDRNRVLHALIRNQDYIDGMLRQTIARLEEASFTIGTRSATKGLVIGDDVQHARQIHARLVDLGYSDVSYVAVGEDGEAANETIRRFRKHAVPAILVAVQKVTEGFDVPDIAVLTYLNTWCAPLFINQMVGRAMRVTARERELDQRLLATVLIPDDVQVRAAFADVLVGAMRLLEAPPEPCNACGKRICTCPLWRRDRQCSVCGFPWFLCTCMCTWCRNQKTSCVCPVGTCERCGELECECPPPPERLLEAVVDLLEGPEVSSSNVNGHQIRDMLLRKAFLENLVSNGLSPMQADACAAALEQVRASMPWSPRDGNDAGGAV